MMRRTIAILLLAGCSPAPADGDPGFETGPCIDGACFDGYACLSDLCVDADGEATEADGPFDDGDGPPGGGPGSGASADDGVDASSADDGPVSSASADDGPVSSDSADDGPVSGDDGASTSDGGIDSAGLGDACDVWAQDCAPGLKCNPWASDGGGAWNDSHCVEVDATPAGLGDACSVQGEATSGEDDCDFGLMCWGVTENDAVGACTELCSGSEAAPVCTTAGTTCSVTNMGSLPLCLPACDPLEQGCGAGEGCYPIGQAFVCAPDASGAGGQYQDGCAFINVCDPGLFCASGTTVPNCAYASCCTPYCDLPAGECPEGATCTDFLDGVGACLL